MHLIPLNEGYTVFMYQLFSSIVALLEVQQWTQKPLHIY